MTMLYLNLWYNEVCYKGTLLYMVRPLVKTVDSHYSTKTYLVGTEKNRLNEMVLLSTQNICLN